MANIEQDFPGRLGDDFTKAKTLRSLFIGVDLFKFYLGVGVHLGSCIGAEARTRL